MSTETARQARNAALIEAEDERARATSAANQEYSRTVARLRAQFEADLAAATARRLEAVRPHHRAYNVAVAAAERLIVEPSSAAAPVRAEVIVFAATRYARPVASLQPVPA